MANEPRILQILSETSDDNEETKAKLKTMARIQADLGGDVSFTDGDEENQRLAYDKIITIAWRMAEQYKPDITREEVASKLNVEQIPDILDLFTEMIRVEVPAELQEDMEEGATEEGGDEEKN
jgi:hypothetical protein